MSHSNVIIIGGGMAGLTVLHELHAADHYLSITLIKDEEITANRGALPYGIDPRKSAAKFMLSNKLITYFGGDLLVDSVERIEPENSRLTTATGQTFSYDHLVFATGAQAMLLPIPGVASPQVLSVRSTHDLAALREATQHTQRAVVIGSDSIGVEIAAILHSLGRQVTIIELLPHLLAGTVDEEFAREIERYLTERGISLRTDARVSEILCAADHRVTGVQLDDSSLIETDFVILSLGVEPDTELAEQSGIAVSKFGIVTDDYLRTNVENIYATGDCAEKKSFLTNKPVRGESETNTIAMSKVVASNILGHHKVFPGVINPYIVTAFTLSCGSAGLSERAAMMELNIVSGKSEVQDKYPMMDDVASIKTKLVFERGSGKIIGGNVLRYNGSVAADVDFLTLAIQTGVTIEQLVEYQYVTHPALTAKPSDNRFVLAARDACY